MNSYRLLALHDNTVNVYVRQSAVQVTCRAYDNQPMATYHVCSQPMAQITCATIKQSRQITICRHWLNAAIFESPMRTSSDNRRHQQPYFCISSAPRYYCRQSKALRVRRAWWGRRRLWAPYVETSDAPGSALWRDLWRSCERSEGMNTRPRSSKPRSRLARLSSPVQT